MTKILYVINFLDQLTFSLLIVVLGPHIYSSGGSQFFSGVILSLSSLIGLIWGPIVGSLSDTKGRKEMLITCLGCNFLGTLLLTTSNYLPVIFIGRLTTAFGQQAIPLIRTLVSDSVPAEKQISFFGKMQALGGLSFIIGGPLGGFLSESSNGVYKVFGLICFLISINIALATTLRSTPRIKNEEKEHKKPNDVSAFQTLSLEFHKIATNIKQVNYAKFWDVFLMKMCVETAQAVFMANLGIIFFKTFNLQGKQLGMVFAFLSISAIVTNLSLVRLRNVLYGDDKIGYKRLHHGTIMLLITTLGFSFSTQVSVFMVFMMTMSMARAILDTTFSQVIVAKASSEEKGRVMGVFESLTSLSGLLIPLISGIVSDMYGNQKTLMISILPALCGSVLAFRQRHQ